MFAFNFRELLDYSPLSDGSPLLIWICSLECRTLYVRHAQQWVDLEVLERCRKVAKVCKERVGEVTGVSLGATRLGFLSSKKSE